MANNEEYSLPVAFSQATEAIAARESKENLTASNPQFVIGAAIAPVLDALTEDLQAMEANGLVKAEHYLNWLNEAPLRSLLSMCMPMRLSKNTVRFPS